MYRIAVLAEEEEGKHCAERMVFFPQIAQYNDFDFSLHAFRLRAD